MATFLTLILKIKLKVKIIIVNSNKINQSDTFVSNFIRFIKFIFKIKKTSFLTFNYKQIFT